MTASQRTRLRSRWCLAGLLAAVCVAFSLPLRAAVTVETFTDYNAFLSLLGPTAQVVNFDDVPTANGFGFFDQNRYAAQGLVFSRATPTALSSPAAVSPPNVYEATFPTDVSAVLGPSQPTTLVTFTRGGQPTPTSAFGTFFIGNTPISAPGLEGVSLAGLALGTNAEGPVPYPAGFTSPTGSTFLGLATVDSSTGQLVPAIDAITVRTGSPSFQLASLDNFTFATPGEVPPVPEANAWALFAGAALCAVGLYHRRPRAST